MDIPISIQTVVLYGSPADPRVQDTAKKLEEQGRMVEVHATPGMSGHLCYCRQILSWPHGHKHLQPC